METHISTTPFGRGAVTLGQIATQMQVGSALAQARKPGSNQSAAVNKWAVFRTLAFIKGRLGISDRTLGVLNALLSFQQETALSLPVQREHKRDAPQIAQQDDGQPGLDKPQPGHDKLQPGHGTGQPGQGVPCDLVVFPSNKSLCLRAHGMAEKTLRRHLGALVEAGLVIRRDSPNGKRYARKDHTGQERFSEAFGFDLTPLVTRASEFESLAENIRREHKALQVARERISLHRRDIAKLIACGLYAGFDGPWDAARQSFLGLVTPLRRIKTLPEFEALAARLGELRAKVANLLEDHVNSQNLTGSDGQNDRHQSNSNTQWFIESEPATEKATRKIEPVPKPASQPEQNAPKAYSLAMVMEACPDIREYAAQGSIRTWPDFIASVRLLRPMLGISPDAWRAAMAGLGEHEASVAVAAILQRSEHSSEAKTEPGAIAGSRTTSVNGSPAIRSPGGYLCALTQKAQAGKFALGPMLMALLGQRLKTKRMAV